MVKAQKFGHISFLPRKEKGKQKNEIIFVLGKKIFLLQNFRNSASNVPLSKLSVALFNSITGQPKDKLFEIPNLIGQISLEVDSMRDVNKEKTPEKGKNLTKDELDENLLSPPHTKNENSNKIYKKVKSFETNLCKSTTEEFSVTLGSFTFKSELLEQLNDWEFNVLNVQDAGEKFNMIWLMFHSLGFLEKYEINTDVFGKFLTYIQEKYDYRNNPFHNFNHGFTGI